MNEFEEVVAYYRYSSDNQNETSIESQRLQTTGYATLNNMKIIAEYIDQAKTGTNTNLKEFQRLISDAEKNPSWRKILVYDYSRFSRNTKDSFEYKDRLKDSGIDLISVTQPKVDDSPESNMLEGMMFVYNDFFSKKLSKVTHDGMKVKAQKACLVEATPLSAIISTVTASLLSMSLKPRL